MKQLWKIITSLNLTQIRSLFIIFFKNPILIFPTIKATRQTIKICNQKFKEDHHKNGQANAFRHALWNALIIYKCKKWTTIERAVVWTKNITDWHEEFPPNDPLAKAMDLHNNKIGRNFFMKYKNQNEEQLVQSLIALIPLSRKHHSVKQMKKYATLIHIEDD